MGPPLSTTKILATLHELTAAVSAPLWLFGGVAVDFLVGRWTRPHGDIDLNAWSTDRDRITTQLIAAGYHSADTGWLTHWHQGATGRALELVFLDREPDGEAVLVIPSDAAIGVPGRHAMVPGYLDPHRWGELEGCRFRVSHPLGEYRARSMEIAVVAGRRAEPKIVHDLALLRGWLQTHGHEGCEPSTFPRATPG